MVHKAITGETWKHVAEPPVSPKVKQKVSDADITIMKELYSSGVLQREIALRFNISEPYVSMLVSGAKRGVSSPKERN